MAQALYRKWRPHRWEDVVGQEHVIQTLRNAAAAGRLAHAYLFAGPRGTGKTTTARLLAKAINCLDDDLAARPCDNCAHCEAVNQGRFLDLIEIDAASNTSVEDVRELRDRINFSPNQGRKKVYIIDEVHMLSTAAFNALLKTLEEPPEHAVFILATTEIHKILPTVLSRCQRHEFRRIPAAEIVAYLNRICEVEGIEAENAALTLVAHQSAGGMRDAISLLDQLASTGQVVSLSIAHTVLGTATSQAILELFEALIAQDTAAGLDIIHKSLDAGSDPRQLARQAVDYARGLILIRARNTDLLDVTPETRAQMAKHAQALPLPDLLRLVKVFNQAAMDNRGNWMPGLPLEMAFLDAVEPPALGEANPAPAAQRTQRAPVHPAPSVQPRAEAAPAPVKESTAELVSDSDEASNQTLEQNWRRILEATRQVNPSVYGLLNSCKARVMKNDVLTFGFSTDVLKSKLEIAETLEVVRNVLKQIFGHEIQVRSVTLTGKRTSPPPGVDSDGMVASALRDLGGEIVDLQ